MAGNVQRIPPQSITRSPGTDEPVCNWIFVYARRNNAADTGCRYQVSSGSDVPAAPALLGCSSNRFCHGFGNLFVEDVGEDMLALRPG
jgi:hypothetical protein